MTTRKAKSRGGAASGARSRMTGERRALHKALLQGRYADAILHTLNNMTMVARAHCDQMRESPDGQHRNGPSIDGIEKAIGQIEGAAAGLEALAEPEGAARKGPPGVEPFLNAALTMFRRLLPRSIQVTESRGAGEDGRILSCSEAEGLRAAAALAIAIRRALDGRGKLKLTIGFSQRARGGGGGGVVRWTADFAPGEGVAKALLGKRSSALDFETRLALEALERPAGETPVRFAAEARGKSGVRLKLEIPCRAAERRESDRSKPIEGTVLLAAGDAYARALTAGLLRGAGCAVVICGSADEALGRWGELEGKGRAMVLDGASLRGLATEKLDQVSHLGNNDHVVMIQSGARGDEGQGLNEVSGCRLKLSIPYAMDALLAAVGIAVKSEN